MLSPPLPHTSARVLEFDLLRDLLRGYASSPLGQAQIAQLVPSTSSDWIRNQHQLTSEIREFRRVGGGFEFSGLLDITRTIDKSRIAGAALETAEIRDVVLIADRAAEWREVSLSPPAAMKTEWHAVGELSSGITDFTDFLRSFRNKILPDGTLDDRASPELARIRREIPNGGSLRQQALRAPATGFFLLSSQPIAQRGHKIIVGQLVIFLARYCLENGFTVCPFRVGRRNEAYLVAKDADQVLEVPGTVPVP